MTSSGNSRRGDGSKLLGGGGWWGGRMGTSRLLEEVGDALVTLPRTCRNGYVSSPPAAKETEMSTRRSSAETAESINNVRDNLGGEFGECADGLGSGAI